MPDKKTIPTKLVEIKVVYPKMGEIKGGTPKMEKPPARPVKGK